MGDRLAHLDVVQRRLAVVHRQDCLALGGADHHVEARIAFELRHGLGRGVVREAIDVAGLQRGVGSGRVGDEAERRAFELHRGAPIALVLGQRDAVAFDAIGEDERTGADRVDLVVVGAFGRDDDGVTPGEVVDQVAVRLLQRQLDGGRIDDLDGLDGGIKGLLGVQRALGIDAIEGELDVLGVECAAVVEGDAFIELEGVGQPVLGNLPGLGERRDDGAIGGEARQALEDVGIDDFIHSRRGFRRRVKAGGLEHQTDLHVGAGLGHGRRQRRSHRQNAGKCEHYH